ncbi:Flagellar hook-length control protein [Halomonas sp. THAF12]|uniref:flagellar hook-length control protein FliK n=1 Tax=Halomonas sp. THAF12 TaxID=2587849 RepID=UPI0012682671|nr:flagellar hook-length control protein FliK [Halomonas sp. THAF12]QFT86637.1 Flagellar hook-length control protein [Halomonas sp. THAF12]
MDIQQILTAGTGKPSASNGGGPGKADALTGDDFARALASLSPRAGARPAPGSGAESSTPASRLPTATADGEALPDRLQRLLDAEGEDVAKELEALLASAGDGAEASASLRQTLASLANDDGLAEKLQTLLASVADGQDPAIALQEWKAAADASQAAVSPELTAALQTLMAQPTPGQGTGQAGTTAAATLQTPASGAPSPLPGLAPGVAAPSTNPLLEAARPRADGAPNAVTSAALAAAEAVRQAAGGRSSAATSPQAMIEALASRQPAQGGNAQDAPLLAGSAAPGGQGSMAPNASPASMSPGSATATAQQASLSAPVGSQAWPRQLGQQLLPFTRQGGEQRIEMKLHPAELGPLSVTLRVVDQGAQAHFLSAHGQVRHALEQAIPQLREALAEQGISLGETSVGEQRQGGTEGEGHRFAGAAGGTSGGEVDAPAEAVTPAAVPGSMRLDGRVDLYA